MFEDPIGVYHAPDDPLNDEHDSGSRRAYQPTLDPSGLAGDPHQAAGHGA
jgi:hypothetical protein